MASASGMLELHARAWDAGVARHARRRLPSDCRRSRTRRSTVVSAAARRRVLEPRRRLRHARPCRADGRHFRRVPHRLRERAAAARAQASSSTGWTTRRVVEGGSLSDGGSLVHWLEQTLERCGGIARGARPRLAWADLPPLLGGERSPGWHQHAKRCGRRAHVCDDSRSTCARPRSRAWPSASPTSPTCMSGGRGDRRDGRRAAQGRRLAADHGRRARATGDGFGRWRRRRCAARPCSRSSDSASRRRPVHSDRSSSHGSSAPTRTAPRTTGTGGSTRW